MIFLLLAVAGVIAGAGVLSLSKFGGTMTKCTTASDTWNDTSQAGCQNSTGSYTSNATTEFRTVLNSQEGMITVGEQFPTIGIIAIMVIVISLIAGVFVYFQYFR